MTAGTHNLENRGEMMIKHNNHICNLQLIVTNKADCETKCQYKHTIRGGVWSYDHDYRSRYRHRPRRRRCLHDYCRRRTAGKGRDELRP